jgi:peptidyl-prolyl cis-trans isomerase SurA
LERAKALSASIHSCEQLEAAAKAGNSPRPSDPGEIRLEGVNPPAFREILTNLPANTTTKPLVASEGIALVMVCSRTQKNMAAESAADIERRLVSERAELASRQLLRDLQRKAQIDQRTTTSAVAASKS